MTKTDKAADNIFALIHNSTAPPNKLEISNALITSTSHGARDFLLPFFMERMVEWNEKNPDNKMEASLVASGEQLLLIINDLPKHRKVVLIDYDGLTTRPDRRAYLDSLTVSCLPKKDKGEK